MSTSCEGKGQRLRSEETMNALLFFLNPNSIQPKTKENEGFYTPAAYLDRLQCGKCLRVFHKRFGLEFHQRHDDCTTSRVKLSPVIAVPLTDPEHRSDPQQSNLSFSNERTSKDNSITLSDSESDEFGEPTIMLDSDSSDSDKEVVTFSLETAEELASYPEFCPKVRLSDCQQNWSDGVYSTKRILTIDLSSSSDDSRITTIDID